MSMTCNFTYYSENLCSLNEALVKNTLQWLCSVLSHYCTPVPALCVHLTQERIHLTIIYERENKRCEMRIEQIVKLVWVWKQIDSLCCCQSRSQIMPYFLSHNNSTMLIVLFVEVITNHNTIVFLRLFISYLFSQSCSSGEHHYLRIVHPIIWGPRLLSWDCKLIQSVGMSVFLTLIPQGAPDMLALGIAWAHAPWKYRDRYIAA